MEVASSGGVVVVVEVLWCWCSGFSTSRGSESDKVDPPWPQVGGQQVVQQRPPGGQQQQQVIRQATAPGQVGVDRIDAKK